MLNIIPPPALQGDEQAQLTQVYRYLFRLSEELNAASTALESQASKASEAVVKAAGLDPATASKALASADSQYTALVSLIVKTANIVQVQMDKIETRLESKYTAESEWGELTEEVIREIEETAKYTIENYQYGSEILNIPEMAADFEAYKIETEGFIKRGIIGYDGENYPILGIAIGQELKSKKVTIDGVVHEEFDTTKNMATYTADKLSFWVNGVEVAYLSNSTLFVTDIVVTDSIKLGDWSIDVHAEDGLTIQQRIGAEIVTASQINLVADQIDLSGNKSIVLTADQINAVADQIDLTANKSITLIAERASKSFRQADMPSEGVKLGDTWRIPNTGETYQAAEAPNAGLVFYLDSDGNISYEADDPTISAEMEGYNLAIDGVVFQEDGSTMRWVLVRDSGMLSWDEFQNYLDLQPDGLYVRAKDENGDAITGAVRIDHNSVDVMLSEDVFTSLGPNYVEFGNYQLRRTADGGLAFKLR